MIFFELKQKHYTYFSDSDSEIRHDGHSGYVAGDPINLYLFRYHHSSEGYDMYSIHPPKNINEETVFKNDII
jgi:hypothetical protein